MIDLIPNKTLLFCVHSSVTMATSKPGRRKYKKKTPRSEKLHNSLAFARSFRRPRNPSRSVLLKVKRGREGWGIRAHVVELVLISGII